MERRGVRRTVLVLALGGILAGGGAPAAAMTGSSGGVAWEIREVTQTARADGRATRWDYVIVLRETLAESASGSRRSSTCCSGTP